MVPADPSPPAKRPCGCAPSPVTPETAYLRIEDPCLRKVVEADLAGEEPAFPLCPDAACSHHRATNADGFRTNFAWTGDYQLLTVRLRKEALRRLRTERGVQETATKATRGEHRRRIWGKREIRKLLTPDSQVAEDRLQRFIEGLRKAGNAGMEGRRLWAYRDAALSAAPTAFPRRPKRCPKCGAESACPSCGRCPTCSWGPCACGDAPGLEGNFIA